MQEFVITSANQAAVYQLYLYAFNGQDSPQRQNFWNDRFNHSIPYGIFENNRLTNALLSIPFSVNFFGQTFKMNGISDVMSAPEAAGKGGASQLMNAALQDMYATGVTLSYLAPFAFSYYRRFGYEQVFDHITYSINSDKLPRVKTNQHLTVTRGKMADYLDQLTKIYQQSRIGSQGGLIRANWWWEYLTKKYPNYEVAVAQDSSKLVGYLLYERTPNKFIVHEVVALNPAARTSLWQFVTKHGTSFQSFEYQAPTSDLALDFLDEPWNLSTQVNPYMMARIVNLKDFLEKYPIKNSINQTINFSVIDSTITENEGQWELSIHDAQLTLTKQSDQVGTNNVLSIQQLTKALFNYRSLASQKELGQIDHNFDNQIIATIDQITVNQTPILADYF